MTQDTKQGLFRSESLDHISSPDQIYDYLKVSNPALWGLIAGIGVLIAAALGWTLTAAIPVTVSTRGIAREEGAYLCYLLPEQAGTLKPGMNAQVDGEEATVDYVAPIPLSREEASDTLIGHYAPYALKVAEWNIAVELKKKAGGGDEPGSFHDVLITTDRIRPLSFLWNSSQR